MQSVIKQNEPAPAELGYHPLPALEGEVVAGPGAEDLVPIELQHGLVVDARGMVAVHDHRAGLPAVPARPRPPRESKERKALRAELEQAEQDLTKARNLVFSLRLRYEASGPRLPEWGG